VLEPLRDSGAAFYVISLGAPSADLSDDSRYRDLVIDLGTRATGGTRTQLLTGTALPGKLEQLADVLTHAYRVTYGRPDSLIPPERITVAARRAGMTAHATPVKEQSR
jgi:hypothetical protein